MKFVEWKMAVQAEAGQYLSGVARRLRDAGVPKRMVEVELNVLVRRAMKSLRDEAAGKAPNDPEGHCSIA